MSEKPRQLVFPGKHMTHQFPQTQKPTTYSIVGLFDIRRTGSSIHAKELIIVRSSRNSCTVISGKSGHHRTWKDKTAR